MSDSIFSTAFDVLIKFRKVIDLRFHQIALEMIQLIAGSKVFHSAITKTIVNIQEATSPYSLHKISLSNTPWMRKLIEKAKKIRHSRTEMSK